MDAKKANQIIRQLERRGYKLHTKNLIGREDYAYMRTVRDADGEERGLLLSVHAAGGAYVGWGCLNAYCRSSYSTVYSGFRLSLDTYEKARYFGTQFLELWTEYLAYNFKVGERLK